MTMSIAKIAMKVIGHKRRWRQYKARTRQLPGDYRLAAEAYERYLMCFGGADGDGAATMFEDLVDLFEQSAADGTPVREVVGADPVEFAEAFLLNYRQGSWIVRERERLTRAVARAAGDAPGEDGPSDEH